jgi:flavin-dependent dehydrogenase
MTAVDFDVVVVGAGRAGTAAAYKLAQSNLDVALLERAKQPGMKNVTGGVLYGQVLEELVPEFPAEAPLERHVVEHNIKLLHGDAEVSIGYRDMALREESTRAQCSSRRPRCETSPRRGTTRSSTLTGRTATWRVTPLSAPTA